MCLGIISTYKGKGFLKYDNICSEIFETYHSLIPNKDKFLKKERYGKNTLGIHNKNILEYINNYKICDMCCGFLILYKLIQSKLKSSKLG